MIWRGSWILASPKPIIRILHFVQLQVNLYNNHLKIQVRTHRISRKDRCKNINENTVRKIRRKWSSGRGNISRKIDPRSLQGTRSTKGKIDNASNNWWNNGALKTKTSWKFSRESIMSPWWKRIRDWKYNRNKN